MIRDFVPMKLVPGEEIIPFKIGQMIPVFIEGVGGVRMNPDGSFRGNEMEVMMRVLEIYSNGDFDGEVIWGES